MGLISFTNLTDGTGIDASDVNTPFNAIYNEFNGNISSDNILNGSIAPADLTASANIEQFRQDACVDFIVSGLGVTTSAGLIGAIASGVVYIGGIRLAPTGNPSKTFTASKDTYVDLDTGGGLVYTEVTNGAASPALTSGYFRLAKVVTSGVAITSIEITGFDSLGNVYSNKNAFGFTQVYFPTLQNSWVDYDTNTYGRPHYTKDKTGTVMIHGLVKSGTVTTGTVIFNLPAGFRPPRQLAFATLSNQLLHRLDVFANGNVVTNTGGSATYLSFNGAAFRAI